MIGYGYWGPNLIRNFLKIRECQVVAIADLDPNRLETAKRLYPFVETTTSAQKVLEAREIDAVIIATPIATHYELAKEALRQDKHILIEKPLTITVAHAEELIRQAKRKRKILMVDHTFIYAGAVRKLRELIDSGELGELYYYDSVRVNLGLLQPDVNVLWDLAPHDFSIMAYLIDKEPVNVSAVGSSPVHWDGWRRESVAYVTVEFTGGLLAHFHLNWLSPVKVRRTLIGGSRRMAIYDHLDPDNQIKIFDKGVAVRASQERYQALVQYRTGDMRAPKVDQTEALEEVCRDFVRCVQTGERPLADGHAGLRVVQLLQAAQQSMENRGQIGRLAHEYEHRAETIYAPANRG
jgi:predicted dehydrogenase